MDPFQLGLGINTIELGGLNQRIADCGSRATGIGADKKGISSAQEHTAD